MSLRGIRHLRLVGASSDGAFACELEAARSAAMRRTVKRALVAARWPWRKHSSYGWPVRPEDVDEDRGKSPDGEPKR